MAGTTMRTGKRGRASVPRNKTGCGTCRIRHKRCDEAKPICENCQNTGRICDGYVDPANGRHFGGHPPRLLPDGASGTVSLAPGPSPGPLFADQHEAQGFRFFEIATEIQVAHSLQNHGWAIPLLQLSHQDPAIRHAVIAAGVMSRKYQASELSVTHDAQANDLHCAAIQQYCKAVANLRSQLGSSLGGSTPSPANALSCCLLLTMFEFMQGNAENMLVHLSTAVRLAGTVGTSPLVQPLLFLLSMTDMIAVLWLNLDRAYSDVLLQFQQLSTCALPPPLQPDLGTLCRDLIDIENDVMTFCHAVACSRQDPPGLNHHSHITVSTASSYVSQVKQAIQSRLSLWHQEFSRTSPSDENSIMHRRSILRANYLLVVLKLNGVHAVDPSLVMPAGRERVVDPVQQTLEQHTEIVDLAEAALAANHPISRYDTDHGEQALQGSGLLPLFSFRTSLTHPVFFVAQKAPDISLRWRAIRLLTDKPWREGAWDSAAMGLIAKRWLEAHIRTNS